MKTPVSTVGELISVLRKYDSSMPIFSAWEGTCPRIEDVVEYNGAVLLDVDGGRIRDAIERQEESVARIKKRIEQQTKEN